MFKACGFGLDGVWASLWKDESLYPGAVKFFTWGVGNASFEQVCAQDVRTLYTGGFVRFFTYRGFFSTLYTGLTNTKTNLIKDY
jgi:hypothetical protein